MNTIIFYGTPAYGHINPTLPIITKMVEQGYRVIYYATEEFRQQIVACGAEFREYDFTGTEWQPEVGSRIFKLAELLLRFTNGQLNSLIEEASELHPVLIMHDTIALWGRMVAERLMVKAASVNTIVTVYPYTKRTLRLYTSRFLLKSIKDVKYLPEIIRQKNKFGKNKFTQLLMNEEAFNIFTYPRLVHPDGALMKEDCFFLGASAILRKSEPEESKYNNLIYVSLGTIFNNSMKFYKSIMEEFGNTEYQVVISCGEHCEELAKENTVGNIHIKSYVNQKELMKQAKVFITAGGMNSICEAAANKVLCLMYPQQGEQYINCKSFEQLGLGKMLDKRKSILKQTDELTKAYKPTEIMEHFSDVRMDELMERIEKYIERKEG